MAKSAKMPMFMANAALQVYQMARAAGQGNDEGVAVEEIHEQSTSVPVCSQARFPIAAGDAIRASGVLPSLVLAVKTVVLTARTIDSMSFNVQPADRRSAMHRSDGTCFATWFAYLNR
ncbi:hypothetical protein WI58_04370 [Burkholderia cepacia]|nr:hypothetical protein WI48_24345 [Burkholderia cepacia]RQS28625.1 hypothetical protein DIE01_35770 [Burkholderia sp. Bp8990]KVA61448.1 hypothetical protein WI47_32880 [Burkholderia cepacia]KVA64935.1 hypothetical protein WI49_16370 [Burkholderia cepacia]KVA87193.1 hypothetical protein WI51_16165 [Burkholderia cepacia]